MYVCESIPKRYVIEEEEACKVKSSLVVKGGFTPTFKLANDQNPISINFK